MRIWVFATVLALGVSTLRAQWSINEVVLRAGERYAGVQVSLDEAAAAAVAVQQARTAYLPRGDFYAQVNRATRNNVFGMIMPNSVIPAISGPPQTANAGTSVWGSATGLLVQWEPFDLGQRGARVAVAEATRVKATRAYARTRFEVEAAAADAYLTVIAADETAQRSQAAVDRAASLETIVTAQAKAGLRPEADSARAQAELAAAQSQLILAQQAARLARISVVQLCGGKWQEVQTRGTFLSAESKLSSTDITAHPAMQEQEASIREAELRKRQADLQWRPRFQTQTALYARGSGDAAQIGPHFYNWGLGLSVLFPFLDGPQIRAQQQIEKYKSMAESQRLKKLSSDLNAQLERAQASLDASQAIARTTPVQLAAARTAHEQARARYQAGLAGITDVVEAQRLLTQSEIDDSLAHLNIWRSHLALAIAVGDLHPFLESTRR